MVKGRMVIIWMLFIIFFSCYHKEDTDKYVTIRKTNSNFYELELKTLNTGRGNLHNLDFSKFEFNEHLWIYFNNLYGKIDADSLIWTKQRGSLYYPWKKEKIKGYIFIDSNMIEINLSYPYYKDGETIEHWEPYTKNGRYQIKLELDSISKVNLITPKTM